jgi:hypothetical protein
MRRICCPRRTEDLTRQALFAVKVCLCKRFDQTFDVARAPRPPPPVEVGQVLLVQLISPITAEGHSAQAGHEKSYIHDTCFDTPDWSAPPRPAIITRFEWDERAGTYNFTAVAIAQKQGKNTEPSTPSISISGPISLHSSSPENFISVEPKWPLEHSYCYAFKRPTKFYCLPSQVSLQ